MRCLEKEDVERVIKDLHDELTGGHYGGQITSHKILQYRYYWATLFKDALAYTFKFKLCKIVVGRETRPTILLQPVTII